MQNNWSNFILLFPRRCWEMSSFEESKALQLCWAGNRQFSNHNRTNLSRIYPKGTRLLSSNFDPIPFWLAGCQMVALNYQVMLKSVAQKAYWHFSYLTFRPLTGLSCSAGPISGRTGDAAMY